MEEELTCIFNVRATFNVCWNLFLNLSFRSSSNKPHKNAKLLPFPDTSELALSTTQTFTKTCQYSSCCYKTSISKTWSLTIFSFPKYFSTVSSISESCYRFFDPSKRFKRLVSRCYSSTTDAKNSCTNLTAKILAKSKSNKLPYLPEPSPKFVCHCHTKVSP